MRVRELVLLPRFNEIVHPASSLCSVYHAEKNYTLFLVFFFLFFTTWHSKEKKQLCCVDRLIGIVIHGSIVWINMSHESCFFILSSLFLRALRARLSTRASCGASGENIFVVCKNFYTPRRIVNDYSVARYDAYSDVLMKAIQLVCATMGDHEREERISSGLAHPPTCILSIPPQNMRML